MRTLRQVTLDRANRKKDRSVSLTFVTELEQSTNEFMEIDELIGQRGLLYFKASGQLTQKELDELDKTEVVNEGKSKSQRLRNVLYRLSEQQGEEFEEFYPKKMEEIIEHFKNQLE